MTFPLLQLRIAIALLADRRARKLAYGKSWREAHPNRRKEWTAQNAEHVKEYRKQWQAEHHSERKAYMKSWCENNTARRRESKRLWTANNIEHVRAYGRKHAKTSNYRKQSHVRLKKSIRALTRFHLYGALKDRTTEDFLGCNVLFFKKWIESQFQPGMSWHNRTAWHLDHIFPLGSCKRGDTEQLALATNYHNIRPIWKRDNQSKNSKVTEDSLVAAYICGISEIHLNKNSSMSPELIAKAERIGFTVV